jgi:hypothetical protein
MRAHGRELEQRLHAHGQGYDYVERPLIRDDETMRLEAGMNITDDGGRRLHSFVQQVISI